MKKFYKCLTAVLVALVTCFTASAEFIVMVDNPLAFSTVMDDTGKEYNLNEGENVFDTSTGSFVAFKLESPWEMVSFTDPNGQAVPYVSYLLGGSYKLSYTSRTTGTYNIETRNPDAGEEEYSFTMNVDNIEALVVQTAIEWENWESFQLTQNETKIPWGDYMMIRFKVADGWKIKTISANNTYEGDFVPEPVNGWYSSYSGQNYTFNITTEQEGAVSSGPTITFNVDNPEAVEVERSMDYDTYESVTLTEKVTKIPWGLYGTIRAKAASGWEIVNCEIENNDGDDCKYSDGTWYFTNAGQDVYWDITTKKVAVEPTFITLTIDNPDAVMFFGSYNDADGTEIVTNFVNGECKIETTVGGVLIMKPNPGYKVVNAPGFQDQSADTGVWGLVFDAGDTNTYAITTVADTQSTFISLTLDNAGSVKVETMIDMRMQEIQPQEGVYKIDTTTAGTIYVSPVDPWHISSIYGNDGAASMTLNKETGSYSLDFEAGVTSTYNIYTVQPTTFTLNIDHPESVKAEVYYDDVLSETLTFTETVNTFPITGWGTVKVYPNESWKIDTCTGEPNPVQKNDEAGYYYVFIGTNADQSLNITTTKEVVETTFITVNVDHPEAITANVFYGEENGVELTPVDGVYKVDTTEGGTLQVMARSPWSIVSAEGFSKMMNRYNLAFTAGAEGTYSITTHNTESGDPTQITLTVDHPEAVTVTVTYKGKEEQTVEPQDGVYTIDTTSEDGNIHVAPVDPWVIEDAGGLPAHWKYVGHKSLDFVAGATGNYTITTNYTDTPEKTYSTLIIDNPEAVQMAQVEYSDDTIDNVELELVKGENKFETTNGGTLVILPNPEWTIVTYEGLQPIEGPFGLMYGAEFEAGATDVYTITSVLASEATHLILNIDNPEGVTVQVAYTDGDATELELQKGDNEVETTKGGDMMITVKENWIITSASGFNPIPGTKKYIMSFEAGNTETYTISVSNVASVDSILNDEVIETAVFNMQGIKVADSTDNLAAGMYIIAGKKVVVK